MGIYLHNASTILSMDPALEGRVQQPPRLVLGRDLEERIESRFEHLGEHLDTNPGDPA